MEINFNGKRALVTGASQGIGRQIALHLAKAGAKVTAIARNTQLLESLHQENPSIDYICLDLSDWNTTKKTLSKLGPIDLLVNNAAVGVFKKIPNFTEDDVDKITNLNIKAVINVTQTVTEQMLARKSPGAIVNISSQFSMNGLENFSVNCATKGALDAFTRAAALELGPHGIRVNCVNPTVVMTEMAKSEFEDAEKAGEALKKIPLGRFAEVGDVADAVVFLLSDMAKMVTGTTLLVDGGAAAI